MASLLVRAVDEILGTHRRITSLSGAGVLSFDQFGLDAIVRGGAGRSRVRSWRESARRAPG
jgi:hypothetical protein